MALTFNHTRRFLVDKITSLDLSGTSAAERMLSQSASLIKPLVLSWLTRCIDSDFGNLVDGFERFCGGLYDAIDADKRESWETDAEGKRLPYPTYEHGRGDSPEDPCVTCRELQSAIDALKG